MWSPLSAIQDLHEPNTTFIQISDTETERILEEIYAECDAPVVGAWISDEGPPAGEQTPTSPGDKPLRL